MYVVCHTCDPAKSIRWNEMPFGRDTHVVPSNTVLNTQFAVITPSGKVLQTLLQQQTTNNNNNYYYYY